MPTPNGCIRICIPINSTVPSKDSNSIGFVNEPMRRAPLAEPPRVSEQRGKGEAPVFAIGLCGLK